MKFDVTVNYSISNPIINAANLDKDYFPEPPTPTNNAFPTGKSRIRAILQIWPIASLNNTKFIYDFVSLYSASLSSKIFFKSAIESIAT